MCRYIRVHTLYQVAKSDGRDGAGSRVVFFSAVAVAAGRRRVAKLAVQCDPQGARHYMHIHVGLCYVAMEHSRQPISPKLTILEYMYFYLPSKAT